MHSFQTRLKISIYKRKLFVFFPVRAPSEYLIVFLSSSSSSLNAKDRSFSSCFHRTQKFLFFPYLIKYKEKETRVVLSVKMVSQQQTKDSGSKKLGIVAPQDKSSKEMKSSKKMKFASSSAETESQTTISDDSKTGRGMSTMPRVVKRKLQKVRPIVEYNKMGKGIGQAHIEMQSYIGVLARSRVPLVDKKWSQIPKDVKKQIWEAVDMAFVVGQGGKKSVLASAAKKWKDFKSTLTRHYILPYTNDKEKLSHPPETYKFIEKAQWDAFVASRLSQDFESVHSQHAQIREKLEYNHRLSRKGYAGLEDELEETMPGVEIDRSTLWKRARQDKHGHRVVDEEAKNIVNSAIKIYNSHIGRAGRKAVIWKTLSGTPKQPSSVECGYYVMRFMREIIMDPSLGFENKYAKGNQEASYPQEAIDEVRNEWAETVFQFIK
ncbi:hypothetical protein L3X38_032102 [Prunus dulcis]|uniref:Ubiquitin-like protease family profile domain-containing protein n=1 Tax=Prunus dulcis TaxID=3755 RepID=A0AAD4VDF2_PRUDU|nr:hypothetical protein L3X38_032102 [Prunus dulcis]